MHAAQSPRTKKTRWDGGRRPASPFPGGPAGKLLDKLGEGGFGEVWRGVHEKTRDVHVYKFCFDLQRLRSFRREITIFRLLRDALGKRPDVAAIYEVQMDNPPFFLESEYYELGNSRGVGEPTRRVERNSSPPAPGNSRQHRSGTRRRPRPGNHPQGCQAEQRAHDPSAREQGIGLRR